MERIIRNEQGHFASGLLCLILFCKTHKKCLMAVMVVWVRMYRIAVSMVPSKLIDTNQPVALLNSRGVGNLKTGNKPDQDQDQSLSPVSDTQ